MTSKYKSDVSLPSDREVKVTRSFAAPAALVYRAYTEPALVTRWLPGVPGWTMPVCEMDVRVGGSYRWRWRNDEDGKEFGFSGEFKEVQPNNKLHHTERFDPGTVGGKMGECLVTLHFLEKNGVTTVTSLMQYESKEVRDAAMATGMTDGMELSFQKLDAVIPTVQ